VHYAVTDAESPSKGGLGGQGFLSSLASLFTGRQLSFSGRTVDKDLSSYNKRRRHLSSEGDAVLSCLDTAEPHAGKRWGTGSAEVVMLALVTYLVIMAGVVRFTVALGYTADPNVTTAEKLGQQFAAIAFLVAALICLQEWFWANCAVKKSISLWVFYINSVTTSTYFYFYLYGEPTVPTYWEGVQTYLHHQETIGALRYLQWSFTTPAMITVISRLVAHSPQADRMLQNALLCDVAMICTGFLERYLPSPYHELFFIVSCSCFAHVLSDLTRLFRIAAQALAEPDHFRVRALYMYTMAMWTLFPVVRLLALWGFLSRSSEEMGFTFLDLATKLVYAISLMQLNNVVVDQEVRLKLKKVQGVLRKEADVKNQHDGEMVRNSLQVYEDKMLAMREAAQWREVRQQTLLAQGFPEDKVTALLDSTLEDYISMSSGDISSYLNMTEQQSSS